MPPFQVCMTPLNSNTKKRPAISATPADSLASLDSFSRAKKSKKKKNKANEVVETIEVIEPPNAEEVPPAMEVDTPNDLDSDASDFE